MMKFTLSDPSREIVLQGIKSACEGARIEAVRADEVEHSSRITDLVLDYIRHADVLIADLSEQRPNVYYEVGFAHGLGKPVILLARVGEVVHFDIKDYSIISYSDVDDLRARLAARLAATFRNRVPDVAGLPAFIAAETPSEIRKSTAVRAILPLEEDVILPNLPDGRFGFTVPWMLNTDGSGVVGGTGVNRISLQPSAGGTAVMEIHKSSRGDVYLLAYADDSLMAQVAARNDRVTTSVISFTPQDGFSNAIGIPVKRILRYAQRSVSSLGYIADVELIA